MQNIYFQYGGIQAFYMYIGAIRVLHKNKHQLDLPNLRVYGCSAGAAFALIFLLVLRDIVTADQVEKELDIVCNKPNEFMFDVAPYGVQLLSALFVKYIGGKNIMRLINKRLFIGISSVNDFRFVRKFRTNYDLCHAIMISCSAPLMSSYVNVYRGIPCLDGGVQFKLHYLPKGTFVIYNATEFPEACTIPDEETKRWLIEDGVKFVGKYLSNDRDSYNSKLHTNEHTFSETTVKNIFLIHKWFVCKDPKWNEIIREFLRQCQSGTSSDSGVSHKHRIANYEDSLVAH
jgi:hypothetical protein